MIRISTLMFLILCTTGLAQVAGRSQAVFTTTESNTLIGEAVFAWQDIDSVLEIDLNRDGRLEASELELADQFLSEYGSTLYHVDADGKPVSVASAHSQVDLEAGTVTFSMEFDRTVVSDPGALSIEFVGHRDLHADHRQALALTDGEGAKLWEKQVGDASARPLFPSTSPVAGMVQGSEATVLVHAPNAGDLDTTRSGILANVGVAAALMGIAFLVGFWLIRRLGIA